MRKHLREIARANMERNGAKQINKPRSNEMGFRIPSLFAVNWRNALETPTEIERKAAKIRANNEKRRAIRNAARV